MGSTLPEHRAKIVAYYDEVRDSYLQGWSKGSLGLHFGLADESTPSLADSIINLNRFLAERAQVTPGLRVLDAGCGFGGSALWLAQEHDVIAEGVTIVPEQVQIARRFARERGLEDRVSFHCMDMLATDFAEASFDVVWNVESLCHVLDARAYFEHVWWLLRDGGRFVCVDLCRGPSPDSEIERQVCDGWAMAPMRTAAELAASLADVGFQEAQTMDLSTRAWRSALAARAVANNLLVQQQLKLALLGEQTSPIHQAHLRAALAMVDGIEQGATRIEHLRAVRPARNG